jgi:3D (Asp-Asp-Asp) domain-containing protein
MKRKVIFWILAMLTVLGFVRCHPIFPSLRKPDAVMRVKTTGYCACRKCCGWKFNWFGMPVYASGPYKGQLKVVGKTASGRMARPGTVAVDPDVFPIGTKFYIPGYGWAVARDTGGDIRGRHLDLFFWRHKTGKEWGPKQSRFGICSVDPRTALFRVGNYNVQNLL